MLATLVTAVISGLRGELVRVEVDVAPGLPVCHIVGLPDAALSEARERVRGAIRNSGFEYPLSRITINLAPADQRKRGAAYDLAIAVGVLVASGQIRASGGAWAMLGELSLSGAVRPVPGILPMVATLARAGYGRVAVPAANIEEARLVTGVEAIGVEGLDDAARLVAGPRGRRAAQAERRPDLAVSGSGTTQRSIASTTADGVARVAPDMGVSGDQVDLADIRGQAHARWALEIALAGSHNLLLVGPPGAGKTLLARAIPGLLPPLDDDEALEVTVIESVSGRLMRSGLRRDRPFRAPHHTASYAALVGGGPHLAPGEVTRAHRGVLFLDELAEFDRNVLDALRQPLEDGTVELARARGSIRYPARLQLVAAMNPCRCGWHGDVQRACRCGDIEADRYVRRVSGPLLDRLDLRVEMPRVAPAELVGAATGEASEVVAGRVAEARARALRRRGGRPNAHLTGAAAVTACGLDRSQERLMRELATAAHMTARGVHRVLRVSRSIADLAGRDGVTDEDLLAAAGLRDPAALPSLAA
ncbi:MAG: YifB family Mg chelatase-like AAA ATPase [Chloroflexota bacterium]|nr:YifB family Mg chelatase-like AAA ATPase [Chloroflexota bacterium]